MTRAALWRSVPTAAVCGLVLVGGCASPSADQPVTVFAAASLTGTLDRIATAYEVDHPGVDIVISYGGSADLASQITDGGPADVFISADEARMDSVAVWVDGEPVPIASNWLTIAVPTGNPAGIEGLGDLSRGDITTVVCAPQVPCGAAAIRLAESWDVTLKPASEEQSVTDVVGKVSSGQADSGLVYVTDIARVPGVEGVAIPGADAMPNHYVAASLSRASRPDVARDFVDYLLGAQAQGILTHAGFGPP